MQLLWTARARRQRGAAIDDIADQDPISAMAVLDRIEQQTDVLLQQPELGRPGRKQGTRERVISRTPLIIVYRVRPRAKRVELLTLLHGSQQWPPA
ncbi:type II toxin-antitoxin system RelE/ParE family toxin [Roseateles saccharophilus]|nr:type II toxin-antitoxin system RelE/ParE family toxin [Roseateles saccharophilus]MDG0835723.1 type II toxin-antitoxin system RelE/ParE family toxin [Roseateles saccharophilus]